MDDLFSCDSSSLGGSGSLERDTVDRHNEEFLVKIVPEGDDCSVLYMLVNIRPDVYYLEASDGINTWLGTYPHSNIASVAKNAKMAENDVAMETKRALTTGGFQSEEYTYTAVKHHKDNSLEITWKKYLATDNVKFTLGRVVLETCSDNQLHSRIMNFAVSEIIALKDTIVELKKEKDRYSNERTAVLQRLEKCVNLKEEIECDLYGKFKLILNEKKAKVRRLMESLNRASSNQVTEKRTHSTAAVPPSTDSTDDEVSESDSNNVTSHTPSPKSKVGGAFKGADSLLKDDWQPEITSPPAKRRKRTKNSTGT